MAKPKADCPNFVPMPTNPDVCAKWTRPDQGPRAVSQFEPFCQVEEKCPSMGMRLTPRADQESDSEE